MVGVGGQCERVSMSKLGGSGGTLPRGNLKFKSSEMAKSASKTVNSNGNFLNITNYYYITLLLKIIILFFNIKYYYLNIKTTSYNLAPMFDKKKKK